VNSPRTASLTPTEGSSEPPHVVRGAWIGGRYEVMEELGRGGYGVVFGAWDRELRRHVALKVRRSDRSDPLSERRFRSEAALARDVVHPNLVRAFDIGAEGDLLYLVLEKVDGSTLAKRLDETGALSIEATLRLAEALLEALDALHTVGIVHRDVKPSNVLLITDSDDGFSVKLGDLGIARKIDSFETRLTQGEAFLGTLAYLPPEILSGEEATFRSDLYSLGVTLCEAILDDLPGDAKDTLANVLSRRRTLITARALRLAHPELPRWLADWLEHLLDPIPAKRYSSAAAALSDLRAQKSPGRRRRAARALGVVTVLAATSALLWLAWGERTLDYRGLRADGGNVVAVGSRGERLWTLEHVSPWSMGRIPLVRLEPRGKQALALIRCGEDLPVGADGEAILELLNPDTGAELRRVRLGFRPLPGVFQAFSSSFLPSQVEALDLNDDGVDEVVVVLNHLPSWPSLVFLYETATDQSRILLTGAGHQVFLAAGDLDGDAKRELIFSGYSTLMRRLRVLSAVRVEPWIGTDAFVTGREVASSPELPYEPGANLAWQVILGRRGAEELTFNTSSKVLELRLEDGRRERLRFDGSDATKQPAPGEAERAAQEEAYASLRETLRLLSLAEWSPGAEEARRAEAQALRAGEPRLAEMSARFEAMARIRSGEVHRGLDRLVQLWGHSEDASDIANDAAEALHLSGHLERAVEWYRRAALQGGAEHLGKDKKDVLLGEVVALVELGRDSEARERIAWYQTSYGWRNSHAAVVTLTHYIDWRNGTPAAALSRFNAMPSLGSGWVWSLLALEFRLSAGESPSTLMPEAQRLESLVTEGRGLFMLFRAELLDRLGRAPEARATAIEAGRLLKPQHEVFEYAMRDVAAVRLKRLGRD